MLKVDLTFKELVFGTLSKHIPETQNQDEKLWAGITYFLLQQHQTDQEPEQSSSCQTAFLCQLSPAQISPAQSLPQPQGSW